MNKKDFSELHRLLAILIYECNKSLLSENISKEYRKKTIKDIEALERIMKVYILDGEIE